MDLSSTTIVRTDSPDGHQAAGEQIRERVARDMETERDIQLLKDVLQRTRNLRVLLDGYDTELSYAFQSAYAEVERRLAFVLLRREEQRDLS